ncbi:hypothetical protein D3C81_1578040 [compost metagenome]
MGHAVAGADHLGDVMDGAAEEYPGIQRREAECLGDHRVEDHRHRGESGHTDHGEQRGLFLLLVTGQRSGQRQCGGGAADRRGAAGEQAEQAVEAHQPRSADRHQDGHGDQHHYHHHRLPAEAGDLFQGDAHAEQRHADTQDLAGGEFDAGLAHAVDSEEVDRHPQQQREQHDRRAVVFGEEGGRRGDHGTDDDARHQGPAARTQH